MSPATVLVVRHVMFEDLGTFEPVLRDRGFEVRYLDTGVEPIDKALLNDVPLLIILGGPIGVSDVEAYPYLREEMDAISSRIESGKPVLGVCLGAQLIAAALGAEVAPTGGVEIGYSPLTLTPEGADSPLAVLEGAPVLHWHGDQFAIPDGAERLASTPGYPNQAFVYGPDQQVLALQFHPEADHERIEQWLIGHSGELAAHGLDPREIRRDAQAYGPELAEKAGDMLNRWLDNSNG